MKKAAMILSILSCILSAVTLGVVLDLQSSLTRTQGSILNEISTLEGRMTSLQAELQSGLEREVSLLAASDWEYLTVDGAARTATLRCTVIPKTCTTGVTAAALTVDGESVAMTEENGVYTAILEVPLMQDVTVERVSFTENGTISAEQLNWSVSPRYSFLPSVYAYLAGSSSRDGQDPDGVYTIRYQGSIELDINCPEPAEFVRAEVVQTLDGRETLRLDVTGQMERRAEEEDYKYYAIPFEQMLELPAGKKMILSVELTDGNGLRYRGIIGHDGVDPDGTPMEWDPVYTNEADILDAGGEPLYTVNEALYQ